MKNPDYRALLENFSSLTALQFVNYTFSIVTFPYLVRVLGVEKFGLLSFAQSFTDYFTLITNYGFYLTGTQQIAITREDKEKAGKILLSIIGAKFLLMMVSFLIFILIVLFFKKFRQDHILYFFSFTMVLVVTFTPYWFFRGIEKMRYITILAAISKVIYTAGIFLLVKSPEQVYLVPLIGTVSTLLIDVEAFRIIYFKLKYKFVIPRINDITYQLKDGFTIFVSQVAVNLYTASNTFILGMLTSNVYVGYYSAAQKIISIVLSMIGLVHQTLYPFVNRLVANQREKAKIFFRKLTKFAGVTGFTITILLFLFAPLFIKIISGPKYMSSIKTLRILSPIPFLANLNLIYGVLIMIPFGFKNEYMKILWGASVINIISALALAPSLKHNGAAISATLTETYVTFAMWQFLRKRRIII
jgi:PST family polysaccharide transporter